MASKSIASRRQNKIEHLCRPPAETKSCSSSYHASRSTLASPDFNPEIEQMLRLDGANLILPPPTSIATYMERSTDPPD